MSNMDWVVNTESNGKDNIDHGDCINCYIPEVKQPNNVNQSKDNAEKDHKTDGKVDQK